MSENLLIARMATLYMFFMNNYYIESVNKCLNYYMTSTKINTFKYTGLFNPLKDTGNYVYHLH
jgi:hypothetical protein